MKTLARFADFDSSAAGWAPWSPRAELAPVFDVDPFGGRRGGGALRIAADCSAAAIGSWRRRIDGVVPGRCYRLTAYHRAEAVQHPRQCISVRLDWRDPKNNRPRNPDNAIATSADGEWSRIDYVTLAPERAASVVIELELRWAAGGTVWWDQIELTELDAPPTRPVRIGTVFHRPRNSASAAESVASFRQLIDSANLAADLICLPEGITVVGTGKSYFDVAESIPGPTTQTLGELARRQRACIVAGIYEHIGPELYNTSVLLDRSGRLVGTYRKTHLPQEEVEAGITPGDAFPVYQTDLARIGMMICWDLQFPEPARHLAINGAEIIALPIWGGSEVLARARAIENHVFLVSATYDMRSFVVSPDGQVLAEATKDRPVAVAAVDLARPIYQPWLGNMNHRTWKERRPPAGGE